MAFLVGWKPPKKKLVINSSLIYVTLTDFILYVKIDSSNANEIFEEVGNDYLKIAIADDSGNQCTVEVCYWNYSEKIASLRIKRTLYSSSNDDLLFYADASHADNTSYIGFTGSTVAKSIWDSAYTTVLSLEQTPTESSGDIKDSTSNENHFTSHNMGSSNLVSDDVGHRLSFDGINEYLDGICNFESGEFTLSFFYSVNSLTEQEHTLFSKGDNYSPGGESPEEHYYLLSLSMEVGQGFLIVDDTVEKYISTNLTDCLITLRGYVQTGGEGTQYVIHFFVNGERVGTKTSSSQIIPSISENLKIGLSDFSGDNPYYEDPIVPLDGTISDIKISNNTKLYESYDDLPDNWWLYAELDNLRGNLISIENASISPVILTTKTGLSYSNNRAEINALPLFIKTGLSAEYPPLCGIVRFDTELKTKTGLSYSNSRTEINALPLSVKMGLSGKVIKTKEYIYTQNIEFYNSFVFQQEINYQNSYIFSNGSIIEKHGFFTSNSCLEIKEYLFSSGTQLINTIIDGIFSNINNLPASFEISGIFTGKISLSSPSTQIYSSENTIYWKNKNITKYVTNLSIELNQESIHDKFNITAKGEELYTQFNIEENNSDSIVITINSIEFRFILEEIEGDENDFTLSGRSISALYDYPFYSDIQASSDGFEMVQTKADEIISGIEWNTLDWSLPQFDIISSPIGCIEKFANAIGSIVRMKHPNDIQVRRRYIERPVNITDSVIVAEFDESNIIQITNRKELGENYSVVEVLGERQEPKDITIDVQTSNPLQGDDVYLFVYWNSVDIQNALQGFATDGKISYHGEETENLTEMINFMEGSSNVSKPIYNIEGIEWIGNIYPDSYDYTKYKKDIIIPIPYAVGVVTYQTKYQKYRVHSHYVPRLITYLEVPLGKRINIEVALNREEEIYADKISNRLISTKTSAIEAGTAFLDNSVYDYFDVEISSSFVDIKDGDVVYLYSDKETTGNYYIYNVLHEVSGEVITTKIRGIKCLLT